MLCNKAGFWTIKVVLLLLVFASWDGVVRAIDIRFDYRFDTNNFFGSAERRNSLEFAASMVEDLVLDDLLSINPDPRPGALNTWKAIFNDPTTGNQQEVLNLPVPSDTIIVFVGGRDLPSGQIGFGGPGGFQASGTQNWLNTIKQRGEPNGFGDGATDFGPWGGGISFDTTKTNGATRDWYFGTDPNVPGGQLDFASTAVHEISHLLGIGTSTSWTRLVDEASGQFEGPNSVAAFGGPVDLDPANSHWKNGTSSLALTTGLSAPAVMDPNQSFGMRETLTSLDLAGLQDIGWSVPPNALALAGDANGDGAVDLADFQILKEFFGSGTLRTQGDLDGNQSVNLNDFSILKDNFGSFATQSFVSVPEPSSLLLALCAATVLPLLLLQRR